MRITCEGCRLYYKENNTCGSRCVDLMDTSKCPCKICLIKMVCETPCIELKVHLTPSQKE